MGDWLGTGSVRPQDIKFLPFEKAKEFAHSLGLKNQAITAQDREPICGSKRIYT
jgi:hypothetical protein